MSDSSHRGAKVGPRIASVVSQAIVATHKALLGTKHKLGMALFNSMSDQISDEVHKTVGPYLQHLADHPQSSDHLKAAAAFLATQHGQLTAMSGITMVGQSILGSLAEIINNAAAPAVRDAIRQSPNLALDPSTLAQIVASGIDTVGDALGDVEGQGFNAGQFAAMVELAHNYPAIAQSLELYRRGVISTDELDVHFARNGLPSDQWSAVRELARQPIGVADAALAVLRGNMSAADAERVAADWGISPGDFNVLIGNTGEPLGLQQLAEALRRGFINEETFIKGVLQSRVRNEWIPTALALRYVPMSVADAVNATVQNHLSETTAAEYAQQNGLEPSHFPILVETAGEPLSRGEMYQLYNRGLATKDQVIQAERESRLKNKYNDLAFNLHERLLEPRMLASAVEYGSVTQQQAIENAMAYGYSKELASVIVGEGAARKLESYKTKVVSSIETLYEDGAIDNATAGNAIVNLGFTKEEASFILEAADMRRATKQTAQVISAVRSKFLARHITDTEAKSLLGTAGVPPTQIAYLMSNWQIEWQAYTRQLTEAQVIKAMKLQLIDAGDALARLIAMGYSETDAGLLVGGA